MREILGDSVTTGRYCASVGLDDYIEEAQHDQEEDYDESQIDTQLSVNTSAANSRSITRSNSQTRRSTAYNSQASDNDDVSDDDSQPKRKRKRGSTLFHPASTDTKKKARGTGPKALNGMAETLRTMVAAIDGSPELGQAQALKRIQRERVLTRRGKLAMLAILENETKALVYSTIETDDLRCDWLREQLQVFVTENGGSLEDFHNEVC